MFKVKYGGKKGKTIELVESPDMVAIRTKGNAELGEIRISSESRSLIKASTEVTNFPEAGITVRRVNATGSEGAVEARDKTREALKQEENIRFAGRVLQDADTGEVTLYTENFFVKFKDTVAEADCLRVIAQYKLTIKSKLAFASNAYFVEAPEGTGLKVFDIAEKLLAEPLVEYCHPELVQERRFKGIHPLQWHLAKTQVNGQAIDAHINIQAAWKITRGKGVTIAVIDDGVDYEHPEFNGRVVHPYDATTNSYDPLPKSDDDKHGTPCAGMACATGLDGGASGTAPEASLMPIRLRNGLGSMAEAQAFVWAADHGADVISCSWGPTDGEWWNPEHPLHTKMTPLPDSTRLAMEYAMTKGRNGKGCAILFAAGNGNEETKYDGYVSNPGVIAVAACNDTGKRCVYSDFGDSVWVSFPSGDYAYRPFRHPAPITEGLRTTDRRGNPGYAPDDYTNNFGGTSGACPGMAGVVALMIAANPTLTPKQIKELIRQSCARIDETDGEYDAQGHSIWYGYGRIDAGKAVEKARATAVSINQTATPPNGLLLLEGTVKYPKLGEIPLKTGELTAVFNPAQKVLGFRFKLKNKQPGLSLQYRVNVSGIGIIQGAEGEFAGVQNGRQRLLGFAIELKGDQASRYELEYAAQIQGSTTLLIGRNGEFCGTDKKTGKQIEAVKVVLKPR